MKLCKDCRFFKPGPEGFTYMHATCTGNKTRVNPVSGENEITFCDNQRNNLCPGKPCGEDAIYFEPKETPNP
jgi:hypothetical protein